MTARGREYAVGLQALGPGGGRRKGHGWVGEACADLGLGEGRHQPAEEKEGRVCPVQGSGHMSHGGDPRCLGWVRSDEISVCLGPGWGQVGDAVVGDEAETQAHSRLGPVQSVSWTWGQNSPILLPTLCHCI